MRHVVMNARTTILVLTAVAVVAWQRIAPANAQEKSAAVSPEMAKLAKALAGDWDTTETMIRSEFFPNGGARHGHSHVALTAGGRALMSEVHSDGSAGKLDGVVIVWWERSAGAYQFFTCFNDSDQPCRVRGTAHWEGETFVNDYEEMIGGKKVKFRDSFINITAKSHSLVAAMDSGNGFMKTLITTTSTRR
jgi:hypothetical protein